jgi:hypothetical protein
MRAASMCTVHATTALHALHTATVAERAEHRVLCVLSVLRVLRKRGALRSKREQMLLDHC